MKKELRRAQKEARRAAKQIKVAPPGPDTYKVFWVEPFATFYTSTWKCPNDHYQRREADQLEVPKTSISCDQCEQMADGWSGSGNTEYVRPDTGEHYRGWNQLPPGAVYDSMAGRHEPHNWVSSRKGNRIKNRPGIDGRVLVCQLPDGHPWTIDSRANNCTLPDDDKHWCWNRSGRPEDGTLDVRKGKPGQTSCSAGGGSIATSRYHGFLHDGALRRC